MTLSLSYSGVMLLIALHPFLLFKIILLDYLGWKANCNGVIRDIFCHYRICPNYAMLTY